MSLPRWIALVLFALLMLAAAACVLDIGRAYERVSGKSKTITSPYGSIEFTDGGAGPAVLVVHGSGGGYDQGELIAQAMLGDEFHWITPSRFGYLGSSLPAGASFDEQAHAYAYLLDHLGIKKVAVVALSQGGPSALLLALLHPDRVSSLTLVSCGVAASKDPDQAAANQKGNLLTSIFRHDPLYWTVSTFFKRPLMTLMGASQPVIAGLGPEQRRLVDQVIDYMNPVAPRSAGVDFDNRAAMPNNRIAGVVAPTLIFHATDDGLQLYRNAEFAAAHIPGARLVSFNTGGHLLIAVEQNTLRAATRQFILDNVDR